MTKNPITNALSATGYILFITSIMKLIQDTQGSKPDSALAPVIFLSMLSFSVAVMAYIFFYQPLVLLIDGKKKEGIKLFMQTLGIFGIITLVISIFIFQS